jgi:CheY-like chemotaxis protein
MDGIETTRKLRALGYNGVIVALTANALAGNDEMFKQNGFDDFISKPIDVRQLNDCLNKFVRQVTANIEPKVREQGSFANNNNFSLLKVFRRDAEKAVVTFRETIANGDIKLFTTTAHAMKSALANIGENEASELAFALEKAGLNGDLEFIAANVEQFIETLESLIKRINQAEIVADTDSGAESSAEAHEGRGSPPEIIENTAYLIEQLQTVINACEDYNRKVVFSVFDSLKQKQWKTSTAAAFEKIHEKLSLHSDFEGTGELAGALLEKYRNKEMQE